ncbi:MAG: CehA/McbA family metallohydrolase [Polyangia bacterium]
MPSLPPEGGAAIATAGRLDAANYDAERVPGPASQGLVGDYFMRNDKVRIVVQAPNRAIGPCPFGGNVIDADRVAQPAGDQLGEVSAFLQLGRTFAFDRAEVVRDGSKGGPAVLRFFGHDAKNDFIDVVGLGGFALAVQDDYRADVDLKLSAAVTYILMPGETRLRIIYTMYNGNETDEKTTWGTLSDTGAQIEPFHPVGGFGEAEISEVVSGGTPPGKYAALLARGIAYGLTPPGDTTAAFPVAGVDVEIQGVAQLSDALGEAGQTLAIKKGGTATREVDLVVAGDVADVTAQALAVQMQPLTPFSGTTEPGARVLVSSGKDAVTVATAGSDGKYAGALPDGDYTIQAEGDGYRRSPTQSLSLHGSAATVDLSVPAAAPLAFTIKDTAGASIPGKISVVGATPNVPDRHFRDTTKDPTPYGLAAVAHSRAGDSSRGDQWDHPLKLAAGHYRVVISRGPEWSRFEQILDVPSTGARVDAVLDHVAPTPGYVACDFHQHTNMSPDAPVPPEDRVMSYLADGVDFISSSEHDVHFDYQPLLDSLGVRGLLDSAVGVETTPWDYGHFIGWPMRVDPTSPNGGALDWAGGEAGLDLTPAQIFDGLRGLGARVVQVNHPRAPGGAFSNFQQNFDRAGLTFDFGTRSFGGNASAAPLAAVVLGLPDGAPLFSDKFDSVEVYNGFHLAMASGEVVDELVDANLRDWMNFVSFGFTPTAVGDSDSHQWYSVPAGLPRTLVAVPDDSAAALQAGIADDVANTVSGMAPRDVVVSNAPFIKLTVDGAGIGRTATHTGGALTIHLEVTTATWAAVDTVELFANATFDVPTPKGAAAPSMAPVVCFSSRVPTPTRCANALGGPRPLTAPIGGGKQSIVLDITDVTPDQIMTLQRAGATGQDLWFVARATGTVGMFPTIPAGVTAATPIDQLIAGNTANIGVGALAFTNPVYVDVDGNGGRAPFAP